MIWNKLKERDFSNT